LKPTLIIRNDVNEGAGQLATLLARRGLAQHEVLGFDTDYSQLPSDQFSALVILGGAQGAYQTEEYPYLLNEMEICRAFVEADKPVAGFCLGAQILACALGGEVLPNDRKEIGWYDLFLTDVAASDPLMQSQPKTLLSYHFHGDYITTVPGGINLAYSAMTECQLFRYGSKAYGFQYHAEVDRPLLESMCRNNRSYLASNGFDAESIINESRTHFSAFEGHCSIVLNNWLDLFSNASASSPPESF
jgi:GMP synthase (glutamine-hydrolysing)